MIKILLLDLETAPNLVHVWGLFQQNVGINQIQVPGYTMCWAAKWYGEDKVMFDSLYKSSAKKMLKGIHKLIEEADAIVTWNGDKFDLPTLNKEFILHGMLPPAPYKKMDLYKTAKQQFKFPSNKLDYVAQALKVGKKTSGLTHDIWIGCMAKDPATWQLMETYNKNDVLILEGVYDKMKPWIKAPANLSLYTDDLVCPSCGGKDFQKRGFHYTQAAKYQRYACKCGHWFKSGGSVAQKPDNKAVSV